MEDSVLRKAQLCVSVEWEIRNFFSERPLSLRSPVFLLSDAEWCLKYSVPPYHGLEVLSLGIQRISSLRKRHHIAYTINIKQLDGRVFWSYHSSHIYTEFESTSDTTLNRSEMLRWRDDLVPDDVLTVYCDFHDKGCEMIENNACEKLSKIKLQIPEGVKILLQNFHDLFLNGFHGDVTVKVKDQEFQAHRSILAARSSVFAAMFDHKTVEKETGIVTISDLNPESFKLFLSFLYTGHLEVVTSSNAVDLYKAADKYDLKDLSRECVRCMAEELCVESVCDVVLLAVVHNEAKLLDVANDFFVENVKAILLTEQWMSFLKENPTLANELLICLVNKKL